MQAAGLQALQPLKSGISFKYPSFLLEDSCTNLVFFFFFFCQKLQHFPLILFSLLRNAAACVWAMFLTLRATNLTVRPPPRFMAAVTVVTDLTYCCI